jgi:hypothetical protein
VKLILTDIDDTILQFADAFQKWAVEKKGYKLNQSIRDGGSIQDAIGCHRDHVDELIVEFSTDPVCFSNIAPEPDALKVIPTLYGMGYQFVAISSCVDGPEVTACRRKNLEDAFGIPWLAVHCVGLLQPKTKVLEAYEPTFWIEDNAGHAMVGDKMGHETYLLERTYNNTLPDVPFEHLYRVPNWHHVFEAIMRKEHAQKR